eukprot:6472399-Amphidinium_carterae.1
MPGGTQSLERSVWQELMQLGFPTARHDSAHLASTVHTQLSSLPGPALISPNSNKHHLQVALLAEDMHFTVRQLTHLGAHIVTQASSHLDMHRKLPQDMQFFMAEVRDLKPQLVWIQYRGAGLPGRRTQ